MDRQLELSAGSKRNFARSIARCLNWCEKEGHIDRNPIRGFEKPGGGQREQVITRAEYKAILAATKHRDLRDLITFAWETGARAAECLKIQKRHLDLTNHRIVLGVSEEKTKRAPRIIYLSQIAEKIVRRQSSVHPSGPVFRNSKGDPWTPDAIVCAFSRLKKKLGVRYCLTAFRHTWCHRMLTSGVDCVTVSQLMGHADPSMVARVYSGRHWASKRSTRLRSW